MIWISNYLPNSGSWKELGLKPGEQTHAIVDVNSRSTRKLNKKSNEENAAIVNYKSGNSFPVIKKNDKQEQKLNVFPDDKSGGVARLGKLATYCWRNVVCKFQSVFFFSVQYFCSKWMWSYNNKLEVLTILLSLHMVDLVSLSSEHHL